MVRSRLRDRVVRDEYTGAQRCIPCTVLNLGLLAVLVAFVGTASIPAAVLVFVIGVSVILARGYLVPFTPTLAPVIAAKLPVSIHGSPNRRSDSLAETYPSRTVSDGGHHEPDAGTSPSTELSDAASPPAGDGETVLAALAEAGVVHLQGSDLELDDGFRDRWRAEMARLREGDIVEAVADETPAATVEHRVEDGTDWYVLADDEGSVASETWLSRPVAIAEVAAARALREAGVPPSIAPRAGAPLRRLLERCPVCDSDLVETTADECCGGYGPQGPQDVLACRSCESHVAVLDADGPGQASR